MLGCGEQKSNKRTVVKDNDATRSCKLLQDLLDLRVIRLFHDSVIREVLHGWRPLEELEPSLVDGILVLLAADILDLDFVVLLLEVLRTFAVYPGVDVDEEGLAGGIWDGIVDCAADGLGFGWCRHSERGVLTGRAV